MTECSSCHVEKPDADFYKHKGQRHGRRCKDCVKGANLVRYHSDPARQIDSNWRGRLRRQYGLTPAQYDSLLEFQGGRCWICEKPSQQRLAVDHDHRTGLVRGLLCANCNYVLGWMKDNARWFARAGGYLDSPPAVQVIGYHRVPGAPPVRENDK